MAEEEVKQNAANENDEFEIQFHNDIEDEESSSEAAPVAEVGENDTRTEEEVDGVESQQQQAEQVQLDAAKSPASDPVENSAASAFTSSTPTPAPPSQHTNKNAAENDKGGRFQDVLGRSSSLKEKAGTTLKPSFSRSSSKVSFQETLVHPMASSAPANTSNLSLTINENSFGNSQSNSDDEAELHFDDAFRDFPNAGENPLFTGARKSPKTAIRGNKRMSLITDLETGKAMTRGHQAMVR
jgi:hypothetical protein